MIKPKVFIGSSTEGLNIAYAIQSNLLYVCETTVWDQGVFNLSESSLDSLIEVLEISDFGIFVFSPDDYVRIRNKKHLTIRDNVLFELGLFVGRLGKKRSYIIVPENTEFHLPTDLIGMTPAKYDANRNDNNLKAGTGNACFQIKELITKLGTLHSSNETSMSVSETADQNSLAKDDWFEYAHVKKDYNKAVEILKKKIRYAKVIEDKIYFKGNLNYIEYQENPTLGFIKFESLIKEYPKSHQAYIFYIYNLIWEGSFNKSLEISEEGLNKCENKTTLTILKAQSFMGLNQKDNAIKTLEDEINLNKSVDAYTTLSDFYLKANENHKAINLLHKAYFIFTNNENVIQKLASLADDNKLNEISIYLNKQLTTLKPDNPAYWANLGNSYSNSQFHNLALTSYEKANEISKEKTGWILDNIGNLYNHKNLYDKAEFYLKKALLLNDESDYTHNRLANVYTSKQDEQKRLNDIIELAKSKINETTLISEK